MAESLDLVTRFLDDKIASGEWKIQDVLNALVESCLLTAQHIEANWQDKYLARKWERLAKRIDTVLGYAQENIP